MNYSHALEELKRGVKMKRRSWKNAKFINIVRAPVEPVPVAGPMAKALGIDTGRHAKFNAYFVVRNSDDSVNPWTPNTFDILQNDWTEYDDD